MPKNNGFSVPELYELCEKESVYYVIRLKSNPILQKLANEFYPSTAPVVVSQSECYFKETEYQAKSWFKGDNPIRA